MRTCASPSVTTAMAYLYGSTQDLLDVCCHGKLARCTMECCGGGMFLRRGGNNGMTPVVTQNERASGSVDLIYLRPGFLSVWACLLPSALPRTLPTFQHAAGWLAPHRHDSRIEFLPRPAGRSSMRFTPRRAVNTMMHDGPKALGQSNCTNQPRRGSRSCAA